MEHYLLFRPQLINLQIDLENSKKMNKKNHCNGKVSVQIFHSTIKNGQTTIGNTFSWIGNCTTFVFVDPKENIEGNKVGNVTCEVCICWHLLKLKSVLEASSLDQFKKTKNWLEFDRNTWQQQTFTLPQKNLLVRSAWTGLSAPARKLALAGTPAQPR